MRKLVALLIIPAIASWVAAGHAVAAEGTIVLTAEEFDANLKFSERAVDLVQESEDPLAPKILIERPDTGADVTTPVEVAVRFESTEDATIDLDSLRIKYGLFDITQRVLEMMSVTDTGINGKIQSMRTGKYSLKISISDSMSRRNNATIKFTVVELDGTQ